MKERERKHTSTEETTKETDSDNQTEKNLCPECSGKLVRDVEHGEVQCGECGLVVEEQEIDRGPEWRSFNDGEGGGEKNNRVGSPLTEMMHDKGLSTQIDWRDIDARGQSLSPRQRQKMKRLRTWNERASAKSSKERNLKQALGEIDRMASALGLPDNIRETASVIYQQALSEDLLVGRSIEGVATASLYTAARQSGVPRSFDKFTEVSRVERIEVERTYQYIVRELGLEVPPANPKSYIPQFASVLGIDDEVQYIATEILENATGNAAVSGKNPVGLAAAAIYAAGLIKETGLTQKEVSEVADISVVTIRNRYTELLDAYDDVDREDVVNK